MQNIKELRNSLSQNYELMVEGKMELKVGKQLANTAGKMIGTLKIELEYAQMRGSKKKIDFLEYE